MNFFPHVWDHMEAVRDEAVNQADYFRTFHPRCDPFELPDDMFIDIFRLNKAMVDDLINLVTNRTPRPSRRSALDPTVKVLTALRFMATGSYQMDIGLNLYMAVSQPSVSRCLHEVVDILNQPDIFNEWVYFPRNFQELQEVRHGFYDKYRIRGVIGCIDCTHVAVVPPKHDIEYLYVNRKGYHSINVQLISDANYRILNANARYPGRSHDSFIWNNSRVLPILERLHGAGHEDYYLVGNDTWKKATDFLKLDSYLLKINNDECKLIICLGDSGYGLRPWLMTPITNAAPGSPEDRYTCQISHIRSLIERVNAVLKMRFRCLLKHRVLHYEPYFASKIINAGAVLHNMCIANRLLPPAMPREDEEQVDFGMHRQFPDDIAENAVRRINPDLARGRSRQRQIIQAYFT